MESMAIGVLHMNLSTLPTDHLYKFLALAGLALFVFSVAYPTNLISDLELRIVESETQIRLQDADISKFEGELDAFEKKKPHPSEQEVLILRDNFQQLKVKKIEVQGKTERLAILNKQLREAFNLLKLSALVGLLMAFVGFLLWYVRVQRPADLLARQQVEGNGT